MRVTFQSGSLRLSGYLKQPLRRDDTPRQSARPALIFCHGLPAAFGSAREAGKSYHVLADRISGEMGWTVLVANYRGCGASEGDFALPGWRDDICAAVEYVAAETPTTGVWLAGFGTGGALALAAAEIGDVLGVVSVAAPADFADWRANSRRLLRHCRDIGVIRDPDYPADFEAWSAGLGAISAVSSACRMSPRPLLVLHGAGDELVPTFDARAIADSHGSADLRIIAAGSHRLRYDPRCISLVLGWLDRRAHDAAPAGTPS